MEEIKGRAPQYYYPNKMARAYLMGLEEALGRAGVNAVLTEAGLSYLVDKLPPNNLNKEFSFEAFAAIQEALEKLYGVRSGRLLALRAGGATFKYGLKEFGAVLGMADLALRVLPLNVKMRVGLSAFAETFNRFSDQIVRLEEDEHHFIWINERCAVCWGRHTDSPCCHAAVGILEEGLRWGSGGKDFEVVEISCIAVGDDACRFRISKTPKE